MNEENLIDEVLLCKFLAGEATPQEAMSVNDWIESNEENKIFYEQLASTWALGTPYLKPVSKKETIERTLPPARNGYQRKSKKLLATPYKIAAAVLLLASISIALYFMMFTTTEQPETAWETKHTVNEVANLSLPDGSSATVNRNSTIKWRKGLRGNDREILLDGEAFFDVVHDPKRPFVIAEKEIKIKVLGTSFNVRHDRKKDNIETNVIRGKVLMYTPEKQIVIEAGMTGVYHRQTKEFILVKTNSKNVIAYATHSLSFSETPLKEVTEQLMKAYGVTFVYENKNIMDCTLTTEYHDKSLSFIMNVISESLGLQYSIKDNIVYISGDGCL